MLQSPTYPSIALLMSSASQSIIFGGGIGLTQETAVLQSRVFWLINKYIEESTGKQWAEELMGCTINLVAFEASLVA
jgi:hypothetical protein